MNKNIFKQNINDFLKAIISCFALGLLGAVFVTFDGPGWISFIAFGIILLFVLIPAVLILFVNFFIKVIQEKPKQSAISLICCVVLPASFFGCIVLLNYVGGVASK